MAMQVKWGNYAFAPGSCRFGVRQKAELDSRQVPFLYNIDIDVTGRLYGNGDGALSIAEVALRNALAVQFQDFRVLRVNGSDSGTSFRNSATLGGITVTAGPDFTGTLASEYVLFRDFTFTISFKLPIPNVARALLDFNESLEFSGGGPDYAMKRAMDDVPQKQLVWAQTEYRVVQRGTAVGFRTWPLYTRPLFPGDFKTSPVVSQDSPQRIGNDQWKYPISWNYVFESVAPLIATPNVWSG